VGELCRKHNCLLIADCVTSISGVPLYLDKWGVDAAYAGTQKALSCPPGVAPLSFSPRAMAKLMNRKTPVANWWLAPSFLFLPRAPSCTWLGTTPPRRRCSCLAAACARRARVQEAAYGGHVAGTWTCA
jgi:aspartate aminotransferase-like enzyme